MVLKRIEIGNQFHYDCKKMNLINQRVKQDIKNNLKYNSQQLIETETETVINPDYVTP
jgi:flagellar biosynthesis/type III secretory pathway chaperone